MIDDSTPVTRALTALNVPHRLFRHPGAIESIEQAAHERGQKTEQVVRSIVFHLGRDQYAMVLIAGASQISWQSLRRYLGQSRLTMASKKEVLEVTGYVTGTVAPFGLPQKLRILVDDSVLKQDEISFGSGESGAGIIMQREDFISALGEVETGCFI